MFAHLDALVLRHGTVLDFALLAAGFEFEGRRRPLMHRQKGIYTPSGSPFALTLKTSIRSRWAYSDHFDGEDSLLYSMQGEGPNSADNRSVCAAFEAGLPLIYLNQVRRTPPRFVVVHPVWVGEVLGDRRSFRVVLQPRDDSRAATALHGANVLNDSLPLRPYLERAYGVGQVRRRLHQARFRDSVLDAYRQQCAMCALPVAALLDAAHIVPDAEDLGDPVVPNGLSLCRIHHRAFDLHLVSVEPESTRVHVHEELRGIVDGPVLEHAFHQLHGAPLLVPKAHGDRPDRERLRQHWTSFVAR